MTTPPPPPVTHRDDVVAVVVSRGPSAYLADVLTSVAQQSVLPRHIIVADTSASEGLQAQVRAIAATHLSGLSWELVRTSRSRTFGSAVKEALRSHGTSAQLPPWLWLLEDDSAPEAGVLATLINAVEHSGAIAIAGPKQVRWDNPRIVTEVGFSATRYGQRHTGIESDEIDQGQYDSREDVLAVGLAGALVRTDVWQELGGTDPVLGPFGDSYDLSRRSRLAGYRVVVVPQAIVRHARLALHGQRPRQSDRAQPAAPPSTLLSVGPRRRIQTYLLLLTCPAWTIPLVVLWALLAAPVRAVGRLLATEPSAARGEVGAALWVLTRIPAAISARLRTKKTRRVPVRALRALESTRAEIAALRREDRRTRAEQRAGVLQPWTDLELADARVAASRRRRWAGLTFMLLIGITAATVGRLIPGIIQRQPLTADALHPTDLDFGTAWAAVTSGWIPTDIGAPGVGDPLLVLIAGLTWLTGSTALTVGIVILLVTLVAGFGAWAASGQLTRSVALRLWTVVMYVSVPVFTTALSQGRLGGLVVHALLGWFVWALIRSTNAGRTVHGTELSARGTIISAATAGLLLCIMVAAAPVIGGIVILVVAVMSLTGFRPRRHLMTVLIPAVALLIPTIWHVIDRGAPETWQLAFASTSGAHTETLPWWQQVLGLTQPPSETVTSGFLSQLGAYLPVVLGLVMVALAVIGLLGRGQQGKVARIGWLLAATGLLTGVLAQRTVIGADAATSYYAWPGPGLSVMTVGLLMASASGLQVLARSVSRREFGSQHLVVASALILAALTPAATLVTWSSGWSANASLQLASDSPVPPVATYLQQGPRQVRVITLQSDDDAIQFRVLRTSDNDLMAQSHTVALDRLHALNDTDAPRPQDALIEAVGHISTGSASTEPANTFAHYGIASVILNLEQTLDDDQRLRVMNAIDATPGFERVTESDEWIIWRVVATEPAGEPAWARTTDPGESITVPAGELRAKGRIEPGAVDRMLIVAEQYDSSWRASFNGDDLDPVEAHGHVAFEIGAAEGAVKVWYDWPIRWPWLITTAAVLGVYFLLALPVGRRRRAGTRV